MATIPAQSTPFPNTLIDRFMPTLKDTEWRILCIIVRQTLGWQEPESTSRKGQDWLTQRQLMQRTGRASAAVSQAIDVLVQRNLINVVSEAGQRLQTPQERQHCMGRLFFRIASHVLTPDTLEDISLGELESSYSETKQGCLKSEVRKVNTTKETENKRTPNGVKPRILRTENKPNALLAVTPNSGSTEENTSHPDTDVRRFLLLYRDLFARLSPRGEMPYLVWGRDGKLVQNMLKQYGYDRLVELLYAFFASDDIWIKKRGYTLACFPTLLPALLMAEEKPKDRLRFLHSTPVVLHSPSDYHRQKTRDLSPSLPLSVRYPELAEKLRHPPP